MPSSQTPEAVTLRDLLVALDAAVAGLVEAPAGDQQPIGSVALLEEADLTGQSGSLPSLALLVGVGEAAAVGWLNAAADTSERAPVAVLSKTTGPALAAAARAAGVALVAIHPQARWEHVLTLIERTLTRSAAEQSDLISTDTDLVDLAQAVASNAGGLVTIEDEQSRVLAYSASDDSADELRRLSILGREGPPDYLRTLQEWGVFNRLRRSDEVVDVPEHPGLGIKRRLVVGIRDPARRDPTGPRLMGTIWVQLGARDFNPEAADVLRGASAIAARIIARSRDAPSTESLLIQRLFGALGGGVDVPSLAGALNLPTEGPAAVIGVALQSGASSSGSPPDAIATVAGVLRLHASAFRRDCLVSVIGGRAYVLLPRYRSAGALTGWTRQLVEQFEQRHGLLLRAAIAAPVADLGGVAAARTEVDRVLDGTAASFPEGRVTTLTESLTAVLLGEILDLLAGRADLHDPRLEVLRGHDRDHGAALRESVEAYLRASGDVRAAAATLTVHPNTLRYRIRRAEKILGLDLSDPDDRLLVAIQLAVLARRSR